MVEFSFRSPQDHILIHWMFVKVIHKGFANLPNLLLHSPLVLVHPPSSFVVEVGSEEVAFAWMVKVDIHCLAAEVPGKESPVQRWEEKCGM